MIEEIIVGSAAVIVCAICVMLVLHKDYEDGLFGRLGLAMMSVAAFGRVLAIMGDEGITRISSVGALLWVGLAIFLIRHFVRFIRWHRSGTHDWRTTDGRAAPGK